MIFSVALSAALLLPTGPLPLALLAPRSTEAESVPVMDEAPPLAIQLAPAPEAALEADTAPSGDPSDPVPSQPEGAVPGQGTIAQGCAVDCTIRAAAQRYAVPATRLLCVAWRESSFNPNAVGYGPRGAVYWGLFQFAPGTWAWASAQAGYSGASPFNPEANAQAAAWLVSHPNQGGGWGHFGTAGGCS